MTMRSTTKRVCLGLLTSSSIGATSSFTGTRPIFAAASSRGIISASSGVISSIDDNGRTARTSASSSSITASPATTSSSLASDYAIQINPKHKDNELLWELYSLNRWDDPNDALRELSGRLYDNRVRDDPISAVFALSCTWAPSDSLLDPSNNIIGTSWSIDVASDATDEVDGALHTELLCILCRIMVQSAASQIEKTVKGGEETLLRMTLPLLDGSRVCQQIHLSNLRGDTNGDAGGNIGVRHLFLSLNSQYADMELVDMVDGECFVLGALPRPYIHTWNILHRGSGILVSKGKDVFQAVKEGEAQLPHLYVHQRTSTKRIFPSLFDMFVGGVSCHGEDSRLTAAREVAEELGLTRALDCILGSKLDNPLSEELFQCTICTSYNRCVVSVFTYTTCNGEIITWQDEEVSWGDYVPYAVVEQAATSSIHRLVESGAWPESALDSMNNIDQSFGDEQFTLTAEIMSKYLVDKWDFVPDGLLVWQAWKAYHSGVTSNTPSSSIRSSS